MSWKRVSDDDPIPTFTINEVFTIEDVKLDERHTSAPDYLTESELISLMEKHGIGTDASIPVHINNICERNYVKVDNGRRLIPTSLGIVLVHGYQKVRTYKRPVMFDVFFCIFRLILNCLYHTCDHLSKQN
jgi:DNA topoisomerase-3